jgi:uncharacterized cupin superfamily protein
VVPEARLEQTEEGLVPSGEGWFILNAKEARWHAAEARGAALWFDDEPEFPQVGINLYVLGPGEAMSMYHWEADQEDFFVLSGEAILIVEGEERRLKQWDFVHFPVGTKHTVIGAGAGPCTILAIGARQNQDGPGWGGYPVDPVAIKHGAGVETETNEAREAYAGLKRREPAPYRDGWLP